MKRPSPFSRENAAMSASMTPLIDVVFLLLIFFLWTSGFQVAEYLLPSELSTTLGAAPEDLALPPPPEADFEEVVIRLTGDPSQVSWQINEVPLLTTAEVYSQLKSIASILADAPVVIHPDPDVPLGVVMDAYDLARAAGFDQIQYAVQDGAS